MDTIKLTVRQKMSESFNEVVKAVFIERQKLMGNNISDKDVYVVGNSDTYYESVVIPLFMAMDHKYLIFTRVDEKSNLIAIYILHNDLFRHNDKRIEWIKIKNKKKDDYSYFFRIWYNRFEQFNSRQLLRHVIEAMNK